MHHDQRRIFESSFAEAKAMSTQGAAHVRGSLDGFAMDLNQVLGGLDEVRDIKLQASSHVTDLLS